MAEDTSAPGENEQPAERKVLALHRQSLAQSVSKLLADAGALDEFNNLSNPLFGTQQSVTRSQAGFGLQMPAAQGADLPVPGTQRRMTASSVCAVVRGCRLPVRKSSSV